jgi:hypothetical protein
VQNRIRVAGLLSFVLWASMLVAQTPMSISPSSGFSSGGQEVTIKGDFGNWPYGVIFGSIDVPATRVDEHTLVAITPPHLPGKARITIFEFDIGIPTELTFEYVGAVPATYERVLLPVFTPPVRGAFGSEFHTDLRVGTRQNLLEIFGLDQTCAAPLFCEPLGVNQPLRLFGGNEIKPPDVAYNGKPGRFLYLPAEQIDALSLNLRVHDVSRADLNFGTEIPVVRGRDFITDRIVLLGVPTDPRFRNTLRIYGFNESLVTVYVEGRPPVEVRLQEGTDVFDPAYAVFTDFPIGSAPVTVTIEAEVHFSPVILSPIWAFITVTNNETQVISTISPQP